MLLERKGKIIPCRRAEDETDAGIDCGKPGTEKEAINKKQVLIITLYMQAKYL